MSVQLSSSPPCGSRLLNLAPIPERTLSPKLFKRDKSVISRHIRNIYKSGELDETLTSMQISTVQSEGGIQVTRNICFYNLDVIISIGYRIKSQRGTQFRIWATKTLKQHLMGSLQKVFQSQIEEMFNALYNLPAEYAENDKSGYVYLLQSPTRYYKIGRTSDPDNRIKTFAVKMPFEVEYLYLIQTSNMAETEKSLHHHFADKRVSGEWFMLDEQDIATIKAWQADR